MFCGFFAATAGGVRRIGRPGYSRVGSRVRAHTRAGGRSDPPGSRRGRRGARPAACCPSPPRPAPALLSLRDLLATRVIIIIELTTFAVRAPPPCVCQTPDSKKEEFRKYLEKSGVIDALTKVLVGLYEEPERPPNAVDYIKRYMGAPTGVDVEAIKAENATLKTENDELKGKITELNQALAAANED